jgi:hypothetical protein
MASAQPLIMPVLKVVNLIQHLIHSQAQEIREKLIDVVAMVEMSPLASILNLLMADAVQHAMLVPA